MCFVKRWNKTFLWEYLWNYLQQICTMYETITAQQNKSQILEPDWKFVIVIVMWYSYVLSMAITIDKW